MNKEQIKMKQTSFKKALPVLFGFFVMGLVDLVGIATNYAKQDFELSDTVANLLPISVFAWFLILSVPTGYLMNRLGRKTTVLLSMVVSLAAMLLPLIAYSYPVLLVAFALLGIGNTIIQVALNPLLTNVVSGEKLTGSLTLGQFIKAIAAFLGPVIAGFAATTLGNWKVVFLVFAAVTVLSGLWLMLTPIPREADTKTTVSFFKAFSLLGDKVILMLFFGIICVVAIDVGLNITIPKFLMTRCDIPLEQAGLGTSLYFVARTIGAFVGAILLMKVAGRRFFLISILIAIPALAIMLFIPNMWGILALIFLVGLMVANVFSIIFGAALKRKPEYANEVSGLLIMGVSGGTVAFLLGVAADAYGQIAAMSLLLIALIYLLFCAFRMEKDA
jgi:fucose permease